jgi:hypothetical protein
MRYWGTNQLCVLYLRDGHLNISHIFKFDEIIEMIFCPMKTSIYFSTTHTFDMKLTQTSERRKFTEKPEYFI